jgi:hypothetical protein
MSKRRCLTCSYSWDGEPDPLCDICDSCQHDPDTGWGGETDHSIIEDDSDNESMSIDDLLKELGGL